MKTDNNSSFTAFLAVWGAILSSITFGWTLYRDLRDKAKIKVTAQIRRIGQREVDGQWYAAEPSMNIKGLGDDPYTKRTCLWGNFKEPLKNPVEPVYIIGKRDGKRYSPIHYAVRTPDRAKIRFITPAGFAKAFFKANQ